jgi:hypothetical protein
MMLVAHTLDSGESLRPHCIQRPSYVQLLCNANKCFMDPAHEMARAYVALYPQELLGRLHTKSRLDACVALGFI